MKTIVILILALTYVCTEEVTKGSPSKSDVSIVSQNFDMDSEGKKFSYDWENSDGTRVDVVGALETDAQGNSGMSIAGNIKYVDPEGVPVAWSFKSDANGTVAEGEVIPTVPPSPPAVLRLLEFLATLPPAVSNRQFQL